MAFEIEKQGEDIIIVELSEKLTLQDLKEVNKTISEKYLATKSGWFIIYNITELDSFPNNLMDVKRVSEPIATSKKVNYQIVVGPKNTILEFVFSVVGQVFRQNLARRRTIDEAIEFIDKNR